MLLGVRCLICALWLENARVVCMPFRGGPVRANLLVRVDCQAYRPTHFTIWLYSYGRSGTLTVSAHKNTTLTPTAPDERSLHYKPVRVIKKLILFLLKPHIYNPHHLKNITSTSARPTPRSNTHFGGKYFWLLLCGESMAIQDTFWFFLFNRIEEKCQQDIWTMRCNKKALGAVMFTAAVSLGTSQMTTTAACTKDVEIQTLWD